MERKIAERKPEEKEGGNGRGEKDVELEEGERSKEKAKRERSEGEGRVKKRKEVTEKLQSDQERIAFTVMLYMRYIGLPWNVLGVWGKHGEMEESEWKCLSCGCSITYGFIEIHFGE
ncbi:hypothetical protein Tco_0292053 [Tanacetum coccineum]